MAATQFLSAYALYQELLKIFFYFFRLSLPHKDNHYFAGHAWHFQLSVKLLIYVQNIIITTFQEPQNLTKNICVFLASWFFSLHKVYPFYKRQPDRPLKFRVPYANNFWKIKV